MREGREAAERDEAERERWLEGPEAAREREESRHAFAGIGSAEARSLLPTLFAEQFATLNSDPARFLSDAQLVRPLGADETAATVTHEGDGSLLDAGVPVRARNEKGELRKVDLSLRATPEGFVPTNPLTDLAIPDSAEKPLQVGDQGLAISPVGIEAGRTATLLGDENVYYHDVLNDTGMMVSPISGGVELFNVLFSEESPEILRYDLDLPSGAVLRPTGTGGAEVVSEGEALATIPFPTAVDAQGTQVPVEMEVEGSSLALRVAHREEDFALPILVDPAIWENWHVGSWFYAQAGTPAGDATLSALGNGAWQYTRNFDYIYGSTWPIYHDWGGSHRGLFISTPNGWFPASTWGRWSYSAPNVYSYIDGVNLVQYWVNNHGCAKATYQQPDDYTGLWGDTSWIQLRYNDAYYLGSSVLDGWGRSFYVGLTMAGANVSIPCWRDLYAGGASVWLDDWAPPSISSPSGIPSGWIGGEDKHTISVNALDAGLGVQHVKLHPEGKPIADEDPVGNCTGLYAHRCPTTNYTSHLEMIGSEFGEGVRSASVSALDPTDKGTSTAPFQTKVDYSKPAVSLDGQLARATGADEGEKKAAEEVEELRLPVYNLTIKATDEGTETNSEHRKRSGVKDIEIWLEEEGQPNKQMPVPWEATPSCVASCSKEETYTLELSELDAVGTHRLEVRVTDFAGNEKVRDIEFEYFPATGMKDEYVMHYFPLPDGQGDEAEEEHPQRPELAVNVMNGNLVYRQVDVDIESSAQVDLEVERYYNSQLPESQSGEWGQGWTLAETPDLNPDGGGSALAAVATMTEDPSLTERYFSLWLDMVTPEGAKAGYELRFKLTAANTYLVTLSRWQAGVETVLGSKSGVAFADGDSLALVDEGQAVSAWAETGSGFAQLLSAEDSAFEEGRAGLHGAGNIVRLADFKAGELGIEASDVAAELAALPVTEPFDGSEGSNARFGSEWSALGWAGGGSNAKGGNTTSGWRPLSAYSTVNGAFHHQQLDGSGGPPDEAELRDHSGAVESGVALPTEVGEAQFDPELQATVKKKAGGGYLMTDETGESATAVTFDHTGQAEALVTEGDANVDYTYEGGELAEIAVEDTSSFATDPAEVEMAEPQATEETPLFHSAFGSYGVGDAEFNTPTDVAMAAQGDLWVADHGNHRIQHFNPAGEFIDQFGVQGAGQGQLMNPASIAIDAEGDIWVADRNNYRIQKFSPEGEYLDQFGSQGSGSGQFNRPEGIAIDASGDLWVSDTYNYRVQKFNAAGEFIEVVAPEGLGPIEPTGIDAGPGGKIWIADWAGNRVVALSEEGGFELSFGSAGSGPGQFNRPDAIEADERGNVWVGDQNNGRIQRFDPSGEYVDEFGSKGSGEGQFSFSYPFGFAVGEDRRLWVADRNNHRVQRWDPPYEVSEEAVPQGDDPSVAVDTEGGLVKTLSGEEAGEISYQHNGELLTAVDGPDGETVYEHDEEDRLTKVTLANGTYGEIAYFSDGRVESVKVDPAGEEPAKTTRFAYTDAPDRSTEVEIPGAPNLTYDIGEDGSVLKWWNTATPPELNLAGTLYASREVDGALLPGDHELQAWAEDEEGVDSIEIVIGGDTLVETCEQVGGPPPECTKTEPLAWVIETEAFAPGHLQIEVIATSDGETAAERLWVDIPEPPPPPAPGTPSPPRFGEIKQFREEYGLEIVFPVANQIERNERIFNLIKAWHEPNTPAGQVARASWERWGVPLRPEDVAELEYRDRYIAFNGSLIDEWGEANRPNSYAGHFVDHPAGGVMKVGFIAHQSTNLGELKSQVPLAASERLTTYEAAPANTLQQLDQAHDVLENAVESNMTLQSEVTEVFVDHKANTLAVGTTNISSTQSTVDDVLGSQAPVKVYFQPERAQLIAGRFRTTGRMRAGDGIYNESRGLCTAGFGAYEDRIEKGTGEHIRARFLLGAGHCYMLDEYVHRPSDVVGSPPRSRVGQVTRNAYLQSHPLYPTDALAVRIKATGVAPRAIYGTGGTALPVVRPSIAGIGTTLCYSGARSNRVSCGQVSAVTTTPVTSNLPFGPPVKWIKGYRVRFNKLPIHEDSGSPVWNPRTNSAVGLAVAIFPKYRYAVVAPLLSHPKLITPGILNVPSLYNIHLITGA